MNQNFYHRISSFLDSQVRCAERYLNRLPVRTIWIGSTVFTAAVSTTLIALLVVAWKHPAGYLMIKPIRVPAYVIEPPTIPERSGTGPMLRHLQHLHQELDSLAASPTGKATYDSLMRHHPGLRDSLFEAENLFLHPYNIQP